MKIPIKWLKEYVKFKLSPEDLAEKLTMAGTEVGAIEYHGGGIENVVCGKIKAVERNDAHLICEIDLGTEIIKTITDDLSLQVGDRVPVASDESKLAEGIHVKKIALSGVESFGMLCRPHELGLAKADHVMKLPLDAKIGMDVKKVLGKNGIVLDLDVLPNRGDLQSIIGVAREVAAVLNDKIQNPNVKLIETNRKVNIKVEVKDKELCPRYMARVIEGVKIKDSPQWIKEKLLLSGVRPINNVVDITNFVLLEYGQPLHAFDADKVDKIVVRKAKAGEKIKTLDEQELKLDSGILVIADSKKPIAVAGIMGGIGTEVALNTQNILLESAFFNPISINKTSQMLKLRSESSVRFGKGVDWDGVAAALDRAAQLIAELGEGKILAGKIDKKAKSRKCKQLAIRVENTNRLLGTKLKAAEIIKILGRLGFKKIKSSMKSVTVSVPLSRFGDIEREVDLVEEVARIYGYDKIDTTISRVSQELSTDAFEKNSRKIKEILAGAGLYEVQTFSILDPKYPERLGLEADYIPIANPLTEDESVLRTIMLPSILKAVDHNLRHQIDDLGIFEVGKVYHKAKSYVETNMLAGALTGQGADFFALKGIIETLLFEFGSSKFESIQSNLLHPGQSAGIIFENKAVGWFGELNPDISKRYDFKKPVYVFEINLEVLFSAIKLTKKCKPLPKFPKSDRDVAMFIKDSVTHAGILETIREVGGSMVEDIQLFDVYKNSRAYRITYRDKNRTLTVDEVNAKHEEILKSLTTKLGVELRK
ncbi:MAG: phenylalanine--tRNA ligase subunit beta [Candidatus Saganbacteria bacterium]|nr:phenylalanine--tRNA ligase subunit beta [Candidatus Saganbacteria bacterium]